MIGVVSEKVALCSGNSLQSAMAFLRASVWVLAMYALVFAIFSPAVVEGQALSPAAAAPGPSSDGTSIDQGIAYLLMLVALVLTYLIHLLDASSYLF